MGQGTSRVEGGTLRQLDAIHPGRSAGRSRGAGCDWIHVAIDDVTRLADMEFVAEEHQATAIGVLSRAVAGFNGQACSAGR